MRTIRYGDIVAAVREMCLEAAFDLPEDVLRLLKRSMMKEGSAIGKSIVKSLLENADIARRERMPLCQDTGFAVFFVDLGSSAVVEGGLLIDAINEGVGAGYREGFLRASIVQDPVFKRKNTLDNTPAAVHLSLVEGDRLRLRLLPKGGGCENMSALAMLKPSDGAQGVTDFVVQTAIKAGPNPCPPTIIGVGIGGTADLAAAIAKKALLRPPGKHHPDPDYAKMERTMLDAINASGVGPQGMGGAITALAVHIETCACHIASLPVAVNFNCHAARFSERII
jgi:fumarate hydratase subunit alpha